jgi:hypothetical protein
MLVMVARELHHLLQAHLLVILAVEVAVLTLQEQKEQAVLEVVELEVLALLELLLLEQQTQVAVVVVRVTLLHHQ